MNSNLDNENKLKVFFSEEYSLLKKYVKSRIEESADRDAEDILQDVAVKLFARNNSSPIHNVAGFVYGSIRNKIVDIMRTRKGTSSVEFEADNQLIEYIDWLYNEADQAYSERMKHALKMAIASLKPKYREVVLAIDFGRMTYRELSEELDVSEGTLMSRRHRALAILNEILTKEKNEN
ncbi:RNA polymerase sigma factor [Crocinitomix algicola]|uniref:RNA polymerase sigma factor n=1 Tax=Crocinitomix algicola TaxID=1740263 RepID=UPI000831C9B2|nr:RNA polymerase sigma factor [Crocinitomix algicola]